MRTICLGIDTTGNYCSVALVDDGRVLSMLSEEMQRGHAERLGPMVKTALQKAGLSAGQISKTSVCAGPGSFTGLRVGMSFAKGLALPHKTPIVGVSVLEVWALNADPEHKARILSVADVRRGQVFWQVFENGQPLNTPALTEADIAMQQIDAHTQCVGNGAHLLGPYDMQTNYVCPARLAWIGMDRNAHTHPATPLYHRPPDAKLPGGKSL